MNKNVLCTLLLSTMPVAAIAAPVGELKTFEPNTPALASEVNSNFSALKIAIDEKDKTINDLNEEITALETRLATLESVVNNLGDDLAQLQSREDVTHTFVTSLKEHTTVGLHNGMPAIKFSGVNVMVNDGSGSSLGDFNPESHPTDRFTVASTPNGLGNLIIGYDEGDATKTGAHNLVIGPGHRYVNRLGIISGVNSAINGLAATIIAGSSNVATGASSVMLGGNGNTVGVSAKGALGGVNTSVTTSRAWLVVDEFHTE